MKDKLRAVGVSGRDLADDDDEYTHELLKIGPWKKRTCRPPQRATGPFFFSRDFVANLKKKKITLWACRPMGGRPGYIFEIFQNEHIFLKF